MEGLPCPECSGTHTVEVAPGSVSRSWLLCASCGHQWFTAVPYAG